MSKESLHFSCPCCGQHAPMERLSEGPFPFALFRKILGGKQKLTPEQRATRRTQYKGSAPGLLNYEEIPMTEDAKELLQAILSALEER